jgi:thioredoxin reductase (NADPH)
MSEVTLQQQKEHAFPSLSPQQIAALEPFGERKSFAAGDEIWAAGTPNMCMNVVIEGRIDILDRRTGTQIAFHEPGGFSGDIDVLNGRPVVVSGIAATDVEVLQLQGDCVRVIVSEQPGLGEIILRAFLLRRALLQASGEVGVLVVGSRYSPDSLRIREFLFRSRYPMHWEDVESSPDARLMLEEFKVDENETPVVVTPGGVVLRKPTTLELASALGVLRPVEDAIVDVVIVGSGPAGLAAAVYGASEGLSTLVVDEEAPGGQAGTSSRIENYMGFPLGISGQELADGAVAQAEKFGARLLAPAVTQSLSCGDAGLHELEIEGVGKVVTRCVVLATGAKYRDLGVEGQERYEGRGIYYAATNVERVLCGEANVAVVGAGNSAGQAAVFMSEKAGHVFLVVRGDDLRKSMSSYLALRIEGLQRDGKLSVLLNSEICELRGENGLEEVAIRDRKTGVVLNEKVAAVFVMIGAVPRTDWLRTASKVALDEKGFVLTGNDVVVRELWKGGARSPYFLETSCPGVFAVGDARSGSIKRVASAVGEGSMAIALVHQYLAL